MALPLLSVVETRGICETVRVVPVFAVTTPTVPTDAFGAGVCAASSELARPASVYAPEAGVGNGCGLERTPERLGVAPLRTPVTLDGRRVGAGWYVVPPPPQDVSSAAATGSTKMRKRVSSAGRCIGMRVAHSRGRGCRGQGLASAVWPAGTPTRRA
jgi:hypothetical protein